MLTKFKCLFFIVALSSGFNSFGQSDWKNWNGLSVDLGFSKRTDLELSHLRSYDINQSFTNTFNQWSVSLDHDFTKKISGKFGYKLTDFSSGNVANRFLVRGSYKIRLADVISWSNGIQAEVNAAAGKGNFYRLIYITRVAPKKRLDFLRLSPSISYWLYYNMGGNAIQYFDETGSSLGTDTPDGIHRSRFTLNLNSKISNNFSLSLYYMNQHEFNLTGRDMNVINPSTGKVERPFHNFQVAGLSLTFLFDFYEKKGRKRNDYN